MTWADKWAYMEDLAGEAEEAANSGEQRQASTEIRQLWINRKGYSRRKQSRGQNGQSISAKFRTDHQQQLKQKYSILILT